jgi:predicted PurR-regulated permease PerM
MPRQKLRWQKFFPSSINIQIHSLMPNKDNQQYILGLVINRYVLMLLGLILIGSVFWYFSQIVTYVLLAWVFSMIGRPLMDLFLKIKIGKFQAGSSAAAGLAIFTFILGIVLFISLFVPMLIKQATNLAQVDYRAIANALEEPLLHLNEFFAKYGLNGEQTPSEQIEHNLKEYFNPTKISTWLSSIVGVAGSILIGFFSIIFITFFFLKESQLFTKTLQNLTPNQANDNISHAVSESSNMLSRYFGGIVIQIFLVSMGLFIGLSILGVPNAALIALLAALFNVIPYVGPIIGGSLGIFLTITSSLDLDFYNQMLPLLGKVALVFAIMQMVDNFLLQPFIFSNRVYAHPLEIFVVVLVGAQVGGILGMVIAIPSYTVIRIIAKNFLSEFHIIQNITKGLQQDNDNNSPE